MNDEIEFHSIRGFNQTLQFDGNNFSILTVQPQQPIEEYPLRSYNKDKTADPHRTDLVLWEQAARKHNRTVLISKK